MTTHLIPAVAICLAAACHSSSTNQPTHAISDTIRNQIDTSEFTYDTIPAEATKADEYYGKPEITGLPIEVMSNVTPEFTIMDTCIGDLNTDKYPDMLVILRRKGEDSLARTADSSITRPLLIFTGQRDKTFKLAEKSENVVSCVTCGGAMGDPYTGMVIKNGYFSLEYYGGSSWRWSRTVTFKYLTPDSTWYLHKDGNQSWSAVDPNGKRTEEIRTVNDFGKVAFSKFDIEN